MRCGRRKKNNWTQQPKKTLNTSGKRRHKGQASRLRPDLTSTLRTSVAPATSPISADGGEQARKRKDNWAQEEMLLLAQLFQERKALIKGDFSVCNARGKAAAWQAILDRLTEAFLRGRTIKDCQKKWQSLQSSAKRNLSANKRALTATGKKCFACFIKKNISQTLPYGTFTFEKAVTGER